MLKKKFKYHSGIQCLHCFDKIFSMSRHDYLTCRCGNVMVDGGFDYFRCGWNVNSIKGKDFKFVRMKYE